jgi:uncharacterized protein YjbI with pentapeptide repeats
MDPYDHDPFGTDPAVAPGPSGRPGSVWRQRDADRLDLAGNAFSNGRFDGVTFEEHDLDRAQFIDVVFAGCRFRRRPARGLQFLRCRFEGCRFEDWTLSDAGFVDCLFTDLRAEASTLRGGTLRDCRLQEATLDRTRLARMRLDGVRLARCRLEGSVLSDCEGHHLALMDSEQRDCGMDGGRFTGLGLFGGQASGLTLGHLDVEDLRFIECSELTDIHLNGIDCQGLRLEDCPRAFAFAAYRATIADLSVQRSLIQALELVESHLSGDNLIAGSRIIGANLSDSEIQGLTLRQCALDDFLVVNRTRFEGLRLEGVRQDPRLELRDRGVTYVDSHRFGH